MDQSKTDQKIKALTTKLQEMEHKWKRALADYQNLEKRVSNHQTQFVKLATTHVINKLLPILDGLEAAAVHLNDKGLNLIVNQLNTVLKSEGLAEIPTQNQVFNPQTMECVDQGIGKANQVIAVIQKGYTLNGIVIRPAKVKVGSIGIHKSSSQ